MSTPRPPAGVGNVLAVLPDRWVNAVARLGPVGLAPKAPGTWGSLAGLLFYAVFLYNVPPVLYVLACLGLLALAVGFCGESARRLRRKDPSEIVLDEFAALPVCFAFIEMWPLVQSRALGLVLLVGFLLFRLFDILKPFGIGRLQRLPGGRGIVADDLAAALATAGCLHGGLWAASALLQ